MFDSEVGKDSSSVDVRRRAFLGFSVSAIAGAVLWSLRKPSLIAAAMPKGDPSEVTIVQFSDSGQRLQRVHVPKIVKNDHEWRQAAFGECVRHNSSCRHRVRLQRKILEPARQRPLPLHMLRQRSFQFGDEIRIRYWLAQFLAADCGGKRSQHQRHQSRCGEDRRSLHVVRCASRACLR